VKHQDGWSIVFSGDTMPTPNLIRAGENATLLIHEATMADDQADMAARKAHSTFGQAVAVGTSMKAETILLTHFSARYPKLPSGTMAPPSTGKQRGHNPVIALAFDHANMRIGDMWKMGYYMPAIEQSFSDTVEEGDGEQEAVTLDMVCT
jgi:ribonuclease Z